MVRHFGFLGNFDVQKNRDAEPKPNGTGYLFSFTKKNGMKKNPQINSGDFLR